MERILKNTLFFLIILCFVLIPLYPKLPLFNIKETFVAIRIEDFLIALTLGLFGIYMLITKKVDLFLNDKLFQALILFFFVGFLSFFSGVYLTHSVPSFNLGLLHFLRRVEFMMLLPVVFFVLDSRKKIVLILFVLSLVVLAVNIYALGQQFLDWPVVSTTNSEFSKGQILTLTPGARVNSTFAGHYDLAVFLAMTLVIISALFFGVSKKIKLWLILLSVLSLGVLILTAARVSFVAAAFGIFINLLLLKKRKMVIFFLITLMAILVYPSQLRDRLISTVTINILNQGQRYEAQTDDQTLRNKINIPTLAVKTSSTSAQSSTFATPSGKIATDITPGEPVDTTQLGVYRSFSIRFNLEWPRAILGLQKNPLLGTGYSSLIITAVKDRFDSIATDNDFLRSLGEVGLLGTFSFALILIEIGKRLKKAFSIVDNYMRHLAVGSFTLILAFLINGVFIDVFEASKVAILFWMFMGIVLAGIKFTK